MYVLGELQGMRRHGEQWLNDGSECEFCECTDGLERCFFHYCNSGPKESYMTPPSAATPAERNPADQPPARPPLDDEDVAGQEGDEDEEEETGSGMHPWESVEDDLERRKTVSSRPGGKGNDPRDDKNPRDNETHDRHDPRRFCGPLPCRKTCPHGYKVDPTTGCRKCKCFKCQPLRRCFLKCRFGYVVDERGCRKCQCRDQSAKVSVITSLDDNDFIVEEGYGVSSEVFSNGTYAEVAESGGVYVTAGEEETQESDPSCNTTRVEGCKDGRGVFAVGAWWDRGSCVSCTCVAPGYTECNVTHCAPPPCPAHRQARHDGMCCPECLPESNRGHQPYLGRGHESRSTSRVPLDRMPPPTLPQDNQDPARAPEMPDEDAASRRKAFGPGDGSTTKSAVQASPADWSQLCVILLPILVVFGLVATLAVHFWRRYHRDKYDINAYRPDEREKLRPVKTADDHQTVRHV
ncbi:cysteine-rich motor neuron 1 protein-like isoform X1 [Penaeus japonicus]|uniref:cysteine-rich motor neuron 1 protein-like isoform X1 n=1 Tax=Penaeus japonicus TaxID=27405 RepID=UPI001C717576|nr:cysteine-rich motor neuron 1 protein-like isoform X1 [Penaeus japonicus]